MQVYKDGDVGNSYAMIVVRPINDSDQIIKAIAINFQNVF